MGEAYKRWGFYPVPGTRDFRLVVSLLIILATCWLFEVELKYATVIYILHFTYNWLDKEEDYKF